MINKMGFSRRVALRYLWSKRSEAFITIITVIALLGVAIGVCVLNMTMAIMTGFEEEMYKKIVGNAHIQIYQYGGVVKHWQDVSKVVSEVPGVSSISGYTQHQALLSIRGASRGIIVRGIQDGGIAAAELAKYLEGRADIKSLYETQEVEVTTDDGNTEVAKIPSIIIGRELSRAIGAFPGDTISILSPQVTSGPFGMMPRFKRFVVTGIYKSGMSGYEEALVYVGLEQAQQFFRTGDAITGFDVKVTHVERARQTATKIQNALTVLPDGGYIVQDWTERNKELWEAMAMEKKAYFIVLLLLIVLASFTIVSALIMIVMEKRKDIAILRTIGATTGSIAGIFYMQGAIIGALGTAIGTVLGIVGSWGLREYGFELPEGVFPTTTLPIKMEPINFLIVAVAAFIICCLSTIYPARRASRLSPSEVLRYE